MAKTGLQKMQNGESFWEKNMEKYPTGLKFAPKIILGRMILRSHTYLKVYKCWRILPIPKTPNIK